MRLVSTLHALIIILATIARYSDTQTQPVEEFRKLLTSNDEFGCKVCIISIDVFYLN